MFRVILLCILTTFFYKNSFAQKHFDPKAASLSKYSGCPENAFCNEITGIKRATFLSLLKKKNRNAKKLALFIKDEGFPAPVWITEEYKNQKDLIRWDSRCPSHNKKGAKIYEALVFTPSLAKLKNTDQLLLQRYTPEAGGASRPAFRGETPLFITRKNEFFYNLEIEGSYFGLILSPKGKMAISSVKSIDNPPQTVSCQKKYDSMEGVPKNLYFNQRCVKVFHQGKKKYQTYYTGRGCI